MTMRRRRRATTATRTTKTVRFDSFDAFLTQACVVPSQQDSSSSRSTTVDKNWAGTKNFEDAKKLAVAGWAEGAAEALSLRASIDAAVREIVCARQAAYTYDLTGDSVDVGRFLSGEPECFVTQTDNGESSNGKVVRLVANLAASGSVSSKSLFARGAVILAAVDIIEACGHRVELHIAHGSSNSHETFQQFALIKSASQPLDVDRLAFCLCHAACLRRLAFSVMEQHGQMPNSSWPAGVNFGEQDAIVTSEAYRGYDFSPKELLTEVAELCEKCGVTIPESEIAELIAQ
jgi:hypothetical protein